MTVTLETEFSETGQGEDWKNAVAKQLNELIQIAHLPSVIESGTVESILCIVQRVCHFEEIFVLKGEE